MLTLRGLMLLVCLRRLVQCFESNWDWRRIVESECEWLKVRLVNINKQIRVSQCLWVPGMYITQLLSYRVCGIESYFYQGFPFENFGWGGQNSFPPKLGESVVGGGIYSDFQWGKKHNFTNSLGKNTKYDLLWALFVMKMYLRRTFRSKKGKFWRNYYIMP